MKVSSMVLFLSYASLVLAGNTARQLVRFAVLPCTEVQMSNTNWFLHTTYSEPLKTSQTWNGSTNVVTITEQ